MEKPTLIQSRLFKDNRGYFSEIYTKKKLINKKYNFVQDNISYSKKGVIRGLHYQFNNPQTKYITVIFGKIFDVAIDLRKKSKHFGKVYSFIMTNQKNNQLIIPVGFAHGFQCLSNFTILHYRCDNYYFSNDQFGIIYDDQFFDIKWPIKKKIISEKDKKLPSFNINENYF